MDWETAVGEIKKGVAKKSLVTIFGICLVDYVGRATSKLPLGKRLVVIKGDGSISIHQNRLVRPTNYMVNAIITTEFKDGAVVLLARRLKPKEMITIKFEKIYSVNSYDMEVSDDLRLTGSEKELNEALMDDLSFLEPGLKPINQQAVLHKGICDIVAEDSEGRLVVIELKRRQADYGSVGQLKRYVEHVKKIKGKETRGILLAPEIRKSALELLQSYGLEYFSYDFELGERSKIKGIGKSQKKISECFQ